MGSQSVHSGGKTSPPLLALADRQWGVVSRAQLRALGVSRAAVDHWLARGRLRPLHHGVYALGHAHLRPEGRWLAAVLACGSGAALSHRSAAARHDLLPYASATIHVIAPRSRHPQPGIKLHRARALDARDVTSVGAVPTTTVARTALDLAATEPPHRVERYLAQADRQGVYDGGALEDVVERNPGHRGAGVLAAQLRREPLLTRSELEAVLLAAARVRGVDPPLANHDIHLPRRGPTNVDFCFPAARLVIEVDSWQHHRSRTSFEDDRGRDLELLTLGHRVARLTARQLRRADELFALVSRLL